MAQQSRLSQNPNTSVEYMSRAEGRAVQERLTKPKAPQVPETKDCQICAYTKLVSSFPQGNHLCEHILGICKDCVEKMVRTAVVDRKLGEAVLDCPFQDCEAKLGWEDLKGIVSREVFYEWDKALLNHFLRIQKGYIACLNTDCGQYFNIEDCRGGRGDANKIECPYCTYELCLECNRPWHPNASCDRARQDEDRESEHTIRRMGVKPCPQCGIRIQKNQGCSQMTCSSCHTDFCWECGADYSITPIPHAVNCPLRANMIQANQGVLLNHFFNQPLFNDLLLDETAFLGMGIFEQDDDDIFGLGNFLDF